jgi:hypothetical protein
MTAKSFEEALEDANCYQNIPDRHWERQCFDRGARFGREFTLKEVEDPERRSSIAVRSGQRARETIAALKAKLAEAEKCLEKIADVEIWEKNNICPHEEARACLAAIRGRK